MSDLKEMQIVTETEKFLDKKQYEIWQAEGNSPAWRYIMRVVSRVRRQSDAIVSLGCSHENQPQKFCGECGWKLK